MSTDVCIADKIYFNAKIYTVNKDFSVCEALAVKNQYLIAVGTNSEMKKFIGEETKIIDVKGKTIIPGLIEGHIHILEFGESVTQIDCFWKSKDEILTLVKNKAITLKPGEWIRSDFGWNEEIWENNSYPSKEELDEVAPNNPVILGRCDGHMVWLNSLALKMAGIDKETPNPKGGEILKKTNGEVLGCLTDNACAKVYDVYPSPSEEEKEHALISAQKQLTRLGITSALALSTTSDTIDVIKKMYKQNQLDVRLSIALGDMPGASEDPHWKKYYESGPEIGRFNKKMNIRAVKFFADGSLGSQSAALKEEYTDRAGHKGELSYTDEQLYFKVAEAYKKGFQVITHAIGDKAVKQVIDIYESVLKERWIENHRFRIEHFQLVTEDDIKRVKELKIIPSMQPIQAPRMSEMAERRIGKTRIKRSYPIGKTIKAGIKVVGGSDAPSSPVNPFWGIYSAVTRKDEQGEPEGGWLSENCISREEALKAYTIWAAYGQFEEGLKGSLEKGKLADFTILDKDIMTCNLEQIKDIKPLATIVAGKLIYERN